MRYARDPDGAADVALTVGFAKPDPDDGEVWVALMVGRLRIRMDRECASSVGGALVEASRLSAEVIAALPSADPDDAETIGILSERYQRSRA